MKLVVGLGNPGHRYKATRHNVGWAVLAELANRYSEDKPKQRFHGEVMDVYIEGVRTLLLAPHTFMNRSGQSVAAARDFYRLNDDEILIVCDDFNLPLGKIRARPSGSAGGQNGLADVIRALGNQDFSRLRLGVGEPPAGWDPAEFVLSKFKKEETGAMEVAVARAADAVVTWAKSGIEECMNQFN